MNPIMAAHVEPSVPFPSLLIFFLLLPFGFPRLLPFNTFCGAEEQNKSSLVVAQIYTQHTWRECKDLGPNRTTARQQKESGIVFV